MARRVEGARVGEGYLVNDRVVACEACGRELDAGEGHVWRCRAGSPSCTIPAHQGPDRARGGWHAACRDVEACRARCTPATPKRGAMALAAAVEAAWAASAEPQRAPLRLEPRPELARAIADLVERDGTLELAQRTEIAQLVMQCTAQVDGLLVDLHSGPFVVQQLSTEPRWRAVRASAAACVAHDLVEYDQVELVLTEERQVA